MLMAQCQEVDMEGRQWVRISWSKGKKNGVEIGVCRRQEGDIGLSRSLGHSDTRSCTSKSADTGLSRPGREAEAYPEEVSGTVPFAGYITLFVGTAASVGGELVR